MARNDPLSYALKLMGFRDYFTEEVRSKVAGKFSSEEADKVIEALEGYGYLNDERAACNYIRSKLKSGYGPYYITGKLYQRGYEASADDVFKIASEEDINLEEKIKELASKYDTPEDGDSYKTYVKCMMFLQNRGYPIWLCNKIVKKGDF